MKIIIRISLCFSILLFVLLVSCDGGLAPIDQEPEPFGVIVGTITYTGEWPPPEELQDLVFVPFPFKPQSLIEAFTYLSQGNSRISDRLQFNKDVDTFVLDEIENGTYIYNIIANQFGPLSLRPVGVYTDNDGVITVEGDTTFIHIDVDFNNLPPFPPE